MFSGSVLCDHRWELLLPSPSCALEMGTAGGELPPELPPGLLPNTARGRLLLCRAVCAACTY